MRFTAVVGLTFLLGSLPLAAQNVDQSPSKLTIVQIAPPSINPCPVGMRVRQGIGSQLMAVKDGHRTRVFASRLHVNLSTPDSSKDSPSQILSATVTVHGLNGKARMLLVGAGPDRAAEVTRTMNVAFAPDNDKSYWSELVLPGFTSTTMVDLRSITYADGSTWKATAHLGLCHATPDPIMLISGH
jgi:hypothetical protein